MHLNLRPVKMTLDAKTQNAYICLRFEICECVHVQLTKTGAVQADSSLFWMFSYTNCKPVLPDICHTNRRPLCNQAAPAPAQHSLFSVTTLQMLVETEAVAAIKGASYSVFFLLHKLILIYFLIQGVGLFLECFTSCFLSGPHINRTVPLQR